MPGADVYQQRRRGSEQRGGIGHQPQPIASARQDLLSEISGITPSEIIALSAIKLFAKVAHNSWCRLRVSGLVQKDTNGLGREHNI
jgi:hypothetical protein